MNQFMVTFSIDDGHPTDLHMAELFSKYGLAATFYIPRSNAEREVLSPPKIRALAQQFEIGAHTINHVSLNSVTERSAQREIREGKDWLEQVLGREVLSFCYPQGKFNRRIVTLVRDAGFLGARTCLLNRHCFPRDPFTCGVSTQAWSHSRTVQLRHAVLERNFSGALNFLRIYKGATDWQRHFLYALDYVELHGGVAHLSLHSWEIDAHDEWRKVEFVLKEVAGRKKFTSITNGNLFRFVTVDTLPITSNGKIDDSALPPPTAENLIGDELPGAPQTPTQQRVLAILGELLGVKQIDINDNFFLLGGHSLLGAQLIARTCESFGVDLPLRTIFDFPTVCELSAKLEELIRMRVEAMSPEEVQHALSQRK